jgi:hypothetical protein
LFDLDPETVASVSRAEDSTTENSTEKKARTEGQR